MSSSRPGQQRCEACRVSGHECDFQRPRCGRCTANAIACNYAETRVDFTFVDQNNAAAIASRRGAHRRYRERGRRTAIPLDTSLLETGQDAPIRQGQSPHFATSILYTLDDRVVQRFIARWAAGQTSLGCLDSMPELYDSSGQDSAMQNAIIATAYADLAAFEHHGDQGTKCYQAYFGSLRRLQDELSNANFVASDSILAAVLAIDAFELLYLCRTDPLGVHTSAILRFLELRKNNTTANNQSYALWRSANQRIFARQLFCEIPSIASFGLLDAAIEDGDRPEVRTIKFVAESCDIMSQLKNERDRPAEQTSREKLLRLSARLRKLMQEAHSWSEHSAAVPKPRRVPFNVQADPDLRQIFTKPEIIVYDNFWVARDRLLFNICSVKILDLLIELRTQAFLTDGPAPIDLDRTRNFLLATQPDMAAIQAYCRFTLDMVPLLIGLVDSNGIAKIDPWILNDTGVLTVKSPLNAITRLNYVLPYIKAEANAVVNFLNAHRHNFTQPQEPHEAPLSAQFRPLIGNQNFPQPPYWPQGWGPLVHLPPQYLQNSVPASATPSAPHQQYPGPPMGYFQGGQVPPTPQSMPPSSNQRGSFPDTDLEAESPMDEDDREADIEDTASSIDEDETLVAAGNTAQAVNAINVEYHKNQKSKGNREYKERPRAYYSADNLPGLSATTAEMPSAALEGSLPTWTPAMGPTTSIKWTL